MMKKEIKIPDIGTEEVEVTEIVVNVGDKILIDDPIIVVEGDKTSMEIPSSENGIVNKILVKVGDKIATNSVIMIIEEHASNCISENNINSSKDILKKNNEFIIDQKDNINNFIDKNIHASPLIRRLSHKFNIELSKIQGTGIKERILKEDIYSHIKNALTFFYKNNNTKIIKKVDYNSCDVIEKIKLSKIQKATGKNLLNNWLTIPHVTLYDQVDITSLEKFRKEQNNVFEMNKINKKITLIVFIIKAVAQALKKFPKFNSSISQDGKEIIFKKYINIGIAVDTIHGLLVPVIYDVNKKNIINLLNDLLIISNKSRNNKLHAKDMQGGCFTISNLGCIGSSLFNPIINAPEVAILGISKSNIKPIWNGKNFVPKLMLPLSLSFDHRIINGVEGISFFNYILSIIHDIRKLII